MSEQPSKSEFHFYTTIEEDIYAYTEEEAMEEFKELYPCLSEGDLEHGTEITNMTERAR